MILNTGKLLPKIHCHVCGCEVTIDADRGKHFGELNGERVRRFRFFCETCAEYCYQQALKRGKLHTGWVMAPRWYGRAAVTLRRRAEKVK